MSETPKTLLPRLFEAATATAQPGFASRAIFRNRLRSAPT